MKFISHSGFSFDSVFFSFAVYCCFMAILKTTADTNAGQSHRLTHCIKSLHSYYLKSLIFKTFKQATGTMILLVYVGSIVIRPASRIE